MLFLEDLQGTLPKVRDLSDMAFDLGIRQVLNLAVYLRISIAQRTKDIESLYRILMFPEDQIYPKMKVFTHVVTFKGGAHCDDKFFRTAAP